MSLPLITFPAVADGAELTALRDVVLSEQDWTPDEAAEIRHMFELEIDVQETMAKAFEGMSRGAAR